MDGCGLYASDAGMTTWEVALVREEGSREVVAVHVSTQDLWSYVDDQEAVLFTREDRMPKTWKQHVADIIDTTEGVSPAGKPYTRRKTRYFKMSMKDWDRLVKLNTWRPKPKGREQVRAEGRAVIACRNGDDLCACLVLDRRCRLKV